MKVSIVTVCYNSAATVAQTLRSVAGQSHRDTEHLIIDGASTDDTLAIVQRDCKLVARVVSEPDKGIYDAMNKGLALATGELVGFLNSDDRYADDQVLADVVRAFEAAPVDYVYGDLRMVNARGDVVREWKTGEVPRAGLAGTQIPHPVLFVRRTLLERIMPAFDPSYRIAADLKQQLILINKLHARGAYVRRPLALMSMGGASTGALSSYLAGWKESVRAYNEIFGRGGAWFTARKLLSKLKGLRRLG